MRETPKQYLARIGKIGAMAKNAALTPEQRQASARKAARARWAKKPAKPSKRVAA